MTDLSDAMSLTRSQIFPETELPDAAALVAEGRKMAAGIDKYLQAGKSAKQSR